MRLPDIVAVLHGGLYGSATFCCRKGSDGFRPTYGRDGAVNWRRVSAENERVRRAVGANRQGRARPAALARCSLSFDARRACATTRRKRENPERRPLGVLC